MVLFCARTVKIALKVLVYIFFTSALQFLRSSLLLSSSKFIPLFLEATTSYIRKLLERVYTNGLINMVRIEISSMNN